MSGLERRWVRRAYERATSPDDLPWHREEPPELLLQAVEAHEKAGRALDLGCGSGLTSCWLAHRGWEVTGIDCVEGALRLARRRADAEGVHVDWVLSDVLTWKDAGPFDLVLDLGCLHALDSSERPTYRRQLLRWLAPSADYVLLHFGRRHALDRRPIGPARRQRQEILEEFGPELVERAYTESIEPAPLPIGPTALVATYWFRHR